MTVRVAGLVAAGVLGALLLYRGAAAAEVTNEACSACHGTEGFASPEGRPLFVSADVFARSVHGTLACTACHADIEEVPHPEKLAPVNCASCHDEIGKDYATSIHGVSRAMGASAAATCKDCHGHHDILPANDPASSVFKLNLPQTCAKCHSNPGLTHEYRMKYPEAPGQYAESIHGRALLKMGLIVAPSCNDCHGVHTIKRSVDRSSPINHANIAKTCGKCHVSVEKIYEQSIHGQLLTKGDPLQPGRALLHQVQQHGSRRSAYSFLQPYLAQEPQHCIWCCLISRIGIVCGIRLIGLCAAL